MKTKEIREYIRQYGHERGTVMVLEAMNEQLQQMRKDLNEMALHFVKLAEHQQQFADFGDIVKTKIMKLEQKDEDDDGLGPSTHSIGRDDN